MQPVLLTIGSFALSSYGLFLILALFLATFVIWKLSVTYDLNVEKVLDLVLLTFFGGLIGARLYFISSHLDIINTPLKMVLINKYPGLSFWGGLLFGILILIFFSKRLKINFWIIGDFAIVGFFLGIFLTSIGCMLASCQYGLPSDLPFAIPQAGLVGKRFPLQIVEGLIFLILFLNLWQKAFKFHLTGSIAALGLILLGISKLILESFRGDRQFIYSSVSLGQVWSILILVLGVLVYYKVSKKSFISDLKNLGSLFTNQNRRKVVVSKILKSCYNLVVDLKVNILRTKKSLFRILNISKNPNRF